MIKVLIDVPQIIFNINTKLNSLNYEVGEVELEGLVDLINRTFSPGINNPNSGEFGNFEGVVKIGESSSGVLPFVISASSPLFTEILELEIAYQPSLPLSNEMGPARVMTREIDLSNSIVTIVSFTNNYNNTFYFIYINFLGSNKENIEVIPAGDSDASAMSLSYTIKSHIEPQHTSIMNNLRNKNKEEHKMNTQIPQIIFKQVKGKQYQVNTNLTDIHSIVDFINTNYGPPKRNQWSGLTGSIGSKMEELFYKVEHISGNTLRFYTYNEAYNGFTTFDISLERKVFLRNQVRTDTGGFFEFSYIHLDVPDLLLKYMQEESDIPTIAIVPPGISNQDGTNNAHEFFDDIYPLYLDLFDKRPHE